MADANPGTGTAADQQDRFARIGESMLAARAGSEEAMGQLVTELSPLLWQVARAAGLRAEDAEDVLQTVWERFFSHMHTIIPVTLTKWLIVTTRREAKRVRDAGRRQLPEDHDWFAALPAQGPGAEELAIADDQRRALWAAMGKLSPQCRELLRIIAFAPRPEYSAIAEALGMAQGSVGPTRGRCLAKLRAILARDSGERSPQ